MNRRVWWRARAPLSVAAARLRAHVGAGLLVLLGVAASVAMLVSVLGGSVIARDREVQKAVAALPESQRSFEVDAFGLPDGQDYAATDRTVRRQLSTLTSQTPLRGTFFRRLRVGGGLVQVGGLDDLAQLVQLRSGRLPRSCVPSRCEVLQLGPGDRATWNEGDIHLVRVGIGAVPDKGVFGDSLVTAPGGDVVPATVLLAAGAGAFDRLPAFSAFYRVYSWVAPLEPRHMHVWQISGLLARESRAQAALGRYGDLFVLNGPDSALLDARAKGRVAAERMVLIGGEVSALMLGFALVCAIGLRRGLAGERRRLLQRGARRLQLWLALGAEVTALTLAGAVTGIAGGAIAVVLLARRAGIPGGAALGHSLGTLLGSLLVLAAWLAATAAVLGAAHLRDSEARRGRVRLVDVAALGALVAVGLGLARGGLNASAASSGNATLLLLLPGLICFVAAVAAARLLGPAMRSSERLSRSGPLPARLALLALARAPSRTVATAAFLLVSLGLALFAAGYRSTLEQGARDEAAYAVPLDFSLTEGSRLVLPLDAAPTAAYARLAPGTHAYPVLRRTASVPGSGASVLSPTVLGLPVAALARLHWRSDFSAASPSELARRLGADGPTELRGLPLPSGAATVSLPVKIGGVAVRLDLAAVNADNGVVLVPLGQKGPGSWVLTARLPAGLRRIVGLEVSLTNAAAFVLQHREAEGVVASAPSGTTVLGPLSAGSRVLTDWHGWVARGGAALTQRTVSYTFNSELTMLLRLPQATDNRPLRVLVSPKIAASAGPGGSLTLEFPAAEVPAQIVGVASRFPDAQESDEGFVIADESRLATALDASLPGTGAPGELWLSVPNGAAAHVERELRRPPFAALDLASRRDIQGTLAGDPLARGTTLTVGVAALVALLLAAVGFWLALVSELNDERVELFDLEAQGVSPDTLRMQFRLRAIVLVGVGALGGAALGLVLSRLVVSLVRISAATGAPEPPLRFEPPWLIAAAGLGALVVVVAVVVELATRRAFPGETPARPSWSLE